MASFGAGGPNRSNAGTLNNTQMPLSSLAPSSTTGGSGSSNPGAHNQVVQELWELHCSGLRGLDPSSDILTQLENILADRIKGMRLAIRWNTSSRQPCQQLLLQHQVVGGDNASQEQPLMTREEIGGVGVRASLFSANSEERDSFLAKIDHLYAVAREKQLNASKSNSAGTNNRNAVAASSRTSAAAASGTNISSNAASLPFSVPDSKERPVWYYASSEIWFDPPGMPAEAVDAWKTSPSIFNSCICYLKALQYWQREQRRVYICMRVLPSPRAPCTPYAALGQGMLNKLVVLTGTVVRIGTSVSVCSHMTFECVQCGTRKNIGIEGVIEFPSDCPGNKGKCRSRQFVPVPNDAEVQAPSVQYAKLQEESQQQQQQPQQQSEGAKEDPNQKGLAPIFRSNNSNGGSSSSGSSGGGGGMGTTTRQLAELCLRGPFKDAVTPGDSITVVGILSKRRQEQANKETRGAHVLTCTVLGLRVKKMSSQAITVNNTMSQLHRQQLIRERKQANRNNSNENTPTNAAGAAGGGGDNSMMMNPLAGDTQFFINGGGLHGESMDFDMMGAQQQQQQQQQQNSNQVTPRTSGGGGGGARDFLSSLRLPPACRIDLLPMLIQRFCPSIYGHVRTKAALLLALVGGSEKPWPEAPRSQIHVLMLGDAGIGKSQLLRAALGAAPRGVMVTANSSSAVGLTVSMSRSNDGTTCEAGAVLHGDGGVTCIDEIDKGGNEQKALLEVMEQNSVSVAKAGLVFSMPVKTSIISAGNPVSGRFDPGKTYAENVGLSAALVSRFDFVMLLADQDGALGGGNFAPALLDGPLRDVYRPFIHAALDKKGLLRNRHQQNNGNLLAAGGSAAAMTMMMTAPSQQQLLRQQDDMATKNQMEKLMGTGGSVAEHVLASHRADGGRNRGRGINSNDAFARPDDEFGIQNNNQQQQAKGRGQNHYNGLYGYDNVEDMTETQQFLLGIDVKSAIECCRGRTPLVSHAAQKVLLDAYVSARRRYFERGTVDAAEVTPRFLQSLIRVTEARAKLAMEDPATEEHARFAVELLEGTRSVSSLSGSGQAIAAGRRAGAGAGGAKKRGNEKERALWALQDEASQNGVDGKPIVPRGRCEAILRDIGIKNPEAMFENLNAAGKLVMRAGKGYEVRD